MRKKFTQGMAIFLTSVMTLSQSIPTAAQEVRQESAAGISAFEQAFLNPDKDARPFMRWWIAPGRMSEDEIRREMKNFANGGYAGVELQCLELAKGCVINDNTWNETMKWILKAGLEYGLQVDFTVGQMWPVATPEITDADDPRAEQQIWEASVDFEASDSENGTMTYSSQEAVLPAPSANPWMPGFDSARARRLVAVTAIKTAADESLDTDSAVSILDSKNTVYDEESGALSWTAPSEGNWKIFYYYSQTSNHTLGFGMNQYVIDHMSPEGTQAVIDNWEHAMNNDAELKALYEENGGSIFGDSFELRSSLWTPAMLDEFKTRRGYDLTPYLPALNHDLGAKGSRVRDDLYTTMTELLSEHHMKALQDWAKTHRMTLRYQAYSSAGSSVFEMTYPALNIDIVEAESYAMSGTVPDSYRQLSGIVHMKKDQIYSAEAAEIGQDDWRETWTDTPLKDGSDNRHLGMMYYANRLFAGGVNKLVFHGSTYKFSDTENMFFPVTQTWPGYSAMSALSYGNEWDDKTPMWETANIMTSALSRMQMVLQQGQGDIDLAVYRSQYGKGNIHPEITALEQNGYTYDYVTPTVLNLDNAVIGTQDQKVVLAADGPSYKALILEPMDDGTVPPMPLYTAEKILSDAKAGLPVIIIGSVPTRANTFPGSRADASALTTDEDAKLSEYMHQLTALANVKTVSDRTEAVAALNQLGITPDAQPQERADLYFQHRNTENADLYFIYNDGKNDSAQTVTLKGNGAPYLLDPWSGEITPIAVYTSDVGSVTVPVELAASDSVMIAVAGADFSSKTLTKAVTRTDADSIVYDETDPSKMAVRSAKGGKISVSFADGSAAEITLPTAQEPIKLTNWKMVLNRWSEGKSVFETNVTPTAEYDLSGSGLIPWYEIDENLKNAAGVAVYTTSFDLSDGWNEKQGACLDFTAISDVGRLTVNGTAVPLNQLSLNADIGKYLVKGTNNITVEVSSNLSNVKYGTDDSNTYRFGIMGDVTLTPYRFAGITPDAGNNETPGTPGTPETPGTSGTPETPENKPPVTPAVPITKLTISADSKKIAAGKKVSLSVAVSPKNAANRSIKWESSNKKYATVSSKGVVTTKKAGKGKTVTITAAATDGSGVKAKITLKLMKHAVTKVQIKNAPKSLKAGKSATLKAAVKTNGKNANKTLKWSSSNNKYATVNSKGVVKAKKAGKGKHVTITASSTDGTGRKASVKIKITR